MSPKTMPRAARPRPTRLAFAWPWIVSGSGLEPAILGLFRFTADAVDKVNPSVRWSRTTLAWPKSASMRRRPVGREKGVTGRRPSPGHGSWQRPSRFISGGSQGSMSAKQSFTQPRVSGTFETPTAAERFRSADAGGGRSWSGEPAMADEVAKHTTNAAEAAHERPKMGTVWSPVDSVAFGDRAAASAVNARGSGQVDAPTVLRRPAPSTRPARCAYTATGECRHIAPALSPALRIPAAGPRSSPPL